MPLVGPANYKKQRVVIDIVAKYNHVVFYKKGTRHETIPLRISFRLEFRNLNETVWANKGRLAEQFVGQHLRCLFMPWEEPRLFYWQRTGGRQGELDFIWQHGPHIIPIEVKAGCAGSMKSLHAFMHAKQLPLAVRLDTNPPSVLDMDVRATTGEQARYRLLSLPLYMTETLPRAIDRLHEKGR
jgi:predicted AAA+ superfamily ATPase